MQIWRKHFLIWGQNFWRGQILSQPKFKTRSKLGARPNLRPKVRPGQFWSQARPTGPGQARPGIRVCLLGVGNWQHCLRDRINQQTWSVNKQHFQNQQIPFSVWYHIQPSCYAKRPRKILRKQWDIVNLKENHYSVIFPTSSIIEYKRHRNLNELLNRSISTLDMK